MWFRIISLILATVCLIEGIAGLVFREQFHGWLRRQCSAARPSGTLRVILVYLTTLVVATWYATIFHYRPYGWVLTLVMTLSGIEILLVLYRWRAVGEAVVGFLLETRQHVGWVYGVAIALGTLLLWLGLFVYGPEEGTRFIWLQVHRWVT